MSDLIEVKATRSFMHPLHPQGQFLRGRFYRVDPDNPLVKGLLEAGYFRATDVVTVEVPDVVDLTGVDEFLDTGVGTRRTRPKKEGTGRKPAGVSNGKGADQSTEEDPNGSRVRHTPGGQDD